MDTTRDLDERVLDAARRLGAEHGKSAASWYELDERNAASVLRGIRDGDPEVLDTLPVLDLSGQWADEPTGPSVTRGVLDDAGVLHSLPGDNHAPGECDRCDWFDGMGTILDEYELGYSQAVQDEIERRARIYLD